MVKTVNFLFTTIKNFPQNHTVQPKLYTFVYHTLIKLGKKIKGENTRKK